MVKNLVLSSYLIMEIDFFWNFLNNILNYISIKLYIIDELYSRINGSFILSEKIALTAVSSRSYYNISDSNIPSPFSLIKLKRISLIIDGQ